MKVAIVVVLGALLLAGIGFYFYKVTKPDLITKFNVTTDKMTKDLEGRTVPLAFGQTWPFDSGQSLDITVLGKRQVEDFIIVAVEIRGIAKITHPERDPKEPEPKEKLPSRVGLAGVGKLTYEWISGEWYLVSVDNITLKANPLN
jgi:hypothetical protein